jgi:hypothetical protein
MILSIMFRNISVQVNHSGRVMWLIFRMFVHPLHSEGLGLKFEVCESLIPAESSSTDYIDVSECHISGTLLLGAMYVREGAAGSEGKGPHEL